jgi:predicted HD phosphohydrolase
VTIAELAEDRVIEGVYAVARKERRRTRGGSPYLVLELVDPSGRIDARVWQDVELLDGRFDEGDAVRVLGRVERFRDRLQLDVRSLEAAPETDPGGLAPAGRRDPDELDGFLDFLAGELTHPGLRTTVGRVLTDVTVRQGLRTLPASSDHHSYAGGLLEHTVAVATLCRETTQLHQRLRGDLLVAAALLHDVGHLLEMSAGPAGPHERTAPAFLAPLFPASVTAPIALHVEAKRYLCAVEPGYHAALSAGSRRSLRRQGGPLADAELATFEATPGWADAVALRRWDDGGKVEGASVPGLAGYEPLLRSLACSES